MDNKILIKKYFEEHSFIESNIKSFDEFVEKGMQEVITEMGEIVPTIIPQEVESFKIKLDKVWITKPHLIEADGSKRDIYPIEARLRNLTYSAPIYLDVSAHIDNVQRENSRVTSLYSIFNISYTSYHTYKLSSKTFYL